MLRRTKTGARPRGDQKPAWTVMISAALLALGAISAPVSAHAQSNGPADAPDGDPIVPVEADDAKMNAAKAEAQATVGQWLKVVDNPPPGTRYIAFKFPLEGWEHIWVGNVRRDGDDLVGTLDNDPHAEGWALGDAVRVPISDISDWTYVDASGYTHGHRTTRVLFDSLPPEVVAQLKKQFGWD